MAAGKKKGMQVVKMSVLPKLVHKINMISIEIPIAIRQDDFKFYI